MFSSNQKLDVLCDFKDLTNVIDFSIKLSGREMFVRPKNPVMPAFSLEVPGVYCFGSGSMLGPKLYPSISKGPGWTDYCFQYDPFLIARIVKQWAESQVYLPAPTTDGSVEKGVRVRSLNSLIDSELDFQLPDHFDPWSCILTFTPDWLVYDK